MDSYHIQHEGDRIGFPPGKAKRLVMEAYERFESDAAAPPPPKGDLEQRGERLLPEGRRQASAGRPAYPVAHSLLSRVSPQLCTKRLKCAQTHHTRALQSGR